MPVKNFGIVTPSEYNGLPLMEAQKKAMEAGFTTRIVEDNGKSFIVTSDLKSNRINFRVLNNIIIDTYTG